MKSKLHFYVGMALFAATWTPSGPARGATAKIPSPAVQAGNFLNLLHSQNFSQAATFMDVTLVEITPPDKLKEIWQKLIDRAGALKKQGEIEVIERPPYSIILITCHFENQLVDFKAVLDERRKLAGFRFQASRKQPPAVGEYQMPKYVLPEAFQEQEIIIGKGDKALPGLLSVPKGEGPFPAVVLLHGMGAYDPDHTIGPNKPFRDLGEALASRGIVTLRYQKRPFPEWSGDAAEVASFTVKEELIDDALAAINLLRQNPAVDPRRVFILGHGLGGTVVPRIEAADPEIAGSIVLAGITRYLEDVIFRESSYLASLNGMISPAEAENLRELTEKVNRVKNINLQTTDKFEMPLGLPPSYWLDIREYRPSLAAAGLTRPMLILQGGRDYQVTLDDFRGWKKDLSERDNITFELYLKLNHLFMTGAGTGKSSPEEYHQPGHVADNVIDDIEQWIKQI